MCLIVLSLVVMQMHSQNKLKWWCRLHHCITVAVNAHNVPGNETRRRITGGVGWCGCDRLCKSIGHSWNEPDGMMTVILETNALLVCVWKFRFCMTLWTRLPRDLEHSFLRLPWTPLHILVLICAGYYPSRKWHQRVQTKNMSQDGLCRMSRTGVCKGGWLAPAPQSDAHWRMQQSATQARQTDALEAEWVACWLSALIPSLSFMQVQIWCHTLPLSESGDAVHSRGDKTCASERIVSVSLLWDGGEVYGAMEQKTLLLLLEWQVQEGGVKSVRGWSVCFYALL